MLLTTCCKGQTPSVIASDHIRIDHAGPIDKPIIPLIISMEKLTLPIYELPIQVDQNIFALLGNYIESSKYLNPQKKINEFGVFKIARLVNGKTEIRFTSTRDESIHFFRDLLDQLNGRQSSEKLVREIKKILTRIDFDSK